MDKRIKECLNGEHGSYILPFLWLHGEPKARIYEEILAIKNSGIRELCAESRPYDNFCKDEWWDDFEFILKTAKELDMRVWLLDDQKFPTGYANGYLENEERAHLRKKLIREIQTDVLGPMKGAKVFVGARVNKEEKIINITAYKKSHSGTSLDYKSAIDLTYTLNDGMIYFDIPRGVWRVVATVESVSYEEKDERLFYYIDMLNKNSCHAMIDAIYQPHYEHFKEYFGNTFAGFFSDEPGFLNIAYTYYNTLGQNGVPYPWSYDLPRLIANSAGIDEKTVWLSLPALWEDLGEITPLIRMHYMEAVTKLYRENFSCLLGDWCREHGVEYIGHVIEDMGAHTRLGYGSGHYFRALEGQDMSGIDIVLMQDIPGINNSVHQGPLADGGLADPAFFRYTLPHLGASCAHIQPLKKGRAMCEIFGAFGWAEGLPFMKGLADIMLASGINYFVPHAFSPKEEDEDCPPHFYNGGKNIHYPLFKRLMEYMGRASHIISGGTHKADVAVFYNAEGEWTGGRYQSFYTLCKTLTQGLIDFDIIPYDSLENAKVKDGKLQINNEEYGALIVSESEIMPISRLECFSELAGQGLDVIFLDSLPERSCEGGDISHILTSLSCVASDKIVDTLKTLNHYHVSGKGEGLDGLRFHHIMGEESSIYLFSNENIYENLDAYITLEEKGECLIYDPWDNKCYKDEIQNGTLHLSIEKGNMLFVIFGSEIPKDTQKITHEVERKILPISFEIAIKKEGEKDFTVIAENSTPFDISAPEHFPSFSGEICYRATLTRDEDFDVIDLGQVGETAEVWLNGKYLGARIGLPYKFSMKDALIDGENQLEIIVRSNLAHFRHDWFSSYMQIPPSGICSDISLCKYK